MNDNYKPVGTWQVTEAEYRRALELSRDTNTSPDHAAAYWQLVRYYHQQIFDRGLASQALELIRHRV